MANISDFQAHFQCDNLFQLFKLTDHVQAMADSGEFFYSDSISRNDNGLSLTIMGEGRWGVDIRAVLDQTINLCTSGQLTDSESGSDFFNQLEFTNSEITYECSNDYFCDEAVDFYGTDYFIDCYWEYITTQLAEDNQESVQDMLDLFAKHGVSIETFNGTQ